MGVPGLVRYLSLKCPRSFSTTAPADIDRIYIDYNSVIHQCQSNIDESIKNIKAMILKYNPNLVYIAIDGTPTRAKMHQQRYRRFMQCKNASPYDSNKITPGTEYMTELHQKLMSVFGDSSKVIISGSGFRGEGEQKIFQHLRDNPTVHPVIIHGLDADLTIMSMMLYVDLKGQYYIMREMTLGELPQIINVDVLAKWVTRMMRTEMGVLEMSASRCVNEFALLCSMLGNDFVPALPGISLNFNGMNILLDICRDMYRGIGEGRELVGTGLRELSDIDLHCLSHIFSKLSNVEYELVRDREDQHTRKVTKTTVPAVYNDTYPLNNIRFITDITKSSDDWRNRYYNHVFGYWSPELAADASQAYIAGLAWSLAYHKQKVLSEGWYYKYIRAPTALDLHHYVISQMVGRKIQAVYDDCDKDFNLYKSVGISLSDWHLMMVLPPCSSHLIQNTVIREIVNGGLYSLRYMFPSDFELSTFLCWKLHECIPIIPEVDLATMIDEYVKT